MLEVQNDYQTNAEKLREIISDYLHITILTPFILNKLIERIEVGQAETVSGQKQQEITIVWRFAGEVLAYPGAVIRRLWGSLIHKNQ